MDGPKDQRVPGQPGSAAVWCPLGGGSPRRSYFPQKLVAEKRCQCLNVCGFPKAMQRPQGARESKSGQIIFCILPRERAFAPFAGRISGLPVSHSASRRLCRRALNGAARMKLRASRRSAPTLGERLGRPAVIDAAASSDYNSNALLLLLNFQCSKNTKNKR